MTTDVDSFLAHYGVKGMKWGKRKSQEPTQPKETKKLFNLSKKQVVIGASLVVGVAATAVIIANRGKIRTSILESAFSERHNSGKRATEEFLKRHGDKTDFALPKGQEFSRISKMAEKEVREATYASFKPRDVAEYKAFWGNEKARHQILIKANSETKFASPKTQLDTLASMVDKKLSSEYGGKSVRQILRSQERTLSGKLFISLADKETLALKYHSRLDVSGWRKNVGSALISELKTRGFSGAVDSVDSGGKSEMPVILFKDAIYNIVSSNKLSTSEIEDAYQSIKTSLGG